MQMECPSEGELWDKSKFFGVVGEALFKYYACHLFKAVSILHD
jgi:serine/threonine protein kinase